MNKSKLNSISRQLITLQESNDYSLFQFKSLVSSHQYSRLYQLILNTLPSGSAILDWGCGNGHFSYFLANQGYQTFGFSFEDFPLRHTLNNLDYSFTKGNIEQPKRLPYQDAEFDAVVSVGVLEHVRETGGNEISSLQEITRILKPGGLFISFPQEDSRHSFSWSVR
ncbi:MAG: class I SAM-dependent methyltransferase [Chroococcales cyanobacterium]